MRGPTVNDALRRSAQDEAPLLELRGLTIEIDGAAPVKDAGFTIHRGRTLALIGESGSGKSLTGAALIGLFPTDRARTTAGTARFEGIDLFTLNERELRTLRGRKIGSIFQEPLRALDPTASIGSQVAEVVRTHTGAARREADQTARRLLDGVGLPERAFAAWPHELSGGQRQRATIAAAMAAEPDLLIADEPSTALDALVQGEILDLLTRLSRERGTALLLITHDLAAASVAADAVAVMYAGAVVETGPAGAFFNDPLHPYARGLLASLPDPFAPGGGSPKTIAGFPPKPGERPSGCPFHPRCPEALPFCNRRVPVQTALADRTVRCLLHEARS